MNILQQHLQICSRALRIGLQRKTNWGLDTEGSLGFPLFFVFFFSFLQLKLKGERKANNMQLKAKFDI